MLTPESIDLDALAHLGTTLTVSRAHMLLCEGDVADRAQQGVAIVLHMKA